MPRKKTTAQLDAEIAGALRGDRQARAHSVRKVASAAAAARKRS